MRLSPVAGEWIDRTQRIHFTFEGVSYCGYRGDTITSALWANGQRLLGRSFKYHRPRGILSLANHDVNVLMQDGSRLNLRADVTPITAGMSLSAVNTWGGVQGDRAQILDVLSPFLPVGFYYKAFHSRRWFPLWERLIRQISGLGKVDGTTPRIRTPKRYDFCDVLVIGAGPSGLSAALTAANAGTMVVIVDENAQAGGSGGYQLAIETDEALRVQELVQAVQVHPNIRLFCGTQAAGYYADHWIPLVNSDYLVKMRAKAVVVASGAYEQPAVFRNNDLPGVMLASAAQRLIYRYAVQPMRRAVVLTANCEGYRAALDLAHHGVQVQAVVDLRTSPPEQTWIEKVRSHEIPIFLGHCIYAAQTNPAVDGVSAAVICPFDAQHRPHPAFSQTIACDGIVMSVGWAPAANLLYQAGTQFLFDPALQQFVPEHLSPGIFACGRVNGVFGFNSKGLDGQRAGQAAATHIGMSTVGVQSHMPQHYRTESGSPSHPWPMVPHPRGKNFVDFDEDLQLKDFYHAAQEGFDNIELLKRYTTVGMGPSQGKHSNLNALRILAQITGKSPGQVGTTTARPFFHPVPLAHLAGRSFTPERHTPLQSRHQALGAVFMTAGLWQRPAYYAQPGKTAQDCIQAEAIAVRTQVGLIDVSTLGKFEIRGTDAAEFLERVYTGRYRNLKVGMTRYALMLDETGVIVDDGVIARLGPDHYYFTTTSAGAAAIYRELSRLAVLWQLDCGLINLTGVRAALNVAGPKARQVLSQLTDLDLSGTNFPYLGAQETHIEGIPVVMMRVGFVGEWGYEIHGAADSIPLLWDRLMDRGTPEGLRVFGVEAQRLLRLEKGHLIVGQDTDGLTTPLEASLGWAVKADKPFFIGQRSLAIRSQQPLRQTLVGFVLNGGNQRPGKQRPKHQEPGNQKPGKQEPGKQEPGKQEPGNQEPGNQGPGNQDGWIQDGWIQDDWIQDDWIQEGHLALKSNQIVGRVTSIGYSASLRRWIGLAYLQPTLAVMGDPFYLRGKEGIQISATVCPTPFYDPENTRQKENSTLQFAGQRASMEEINSLEKIKSVEASRSSNE